MFCYCLLLFKGNIVDCSFRDHLLFYLFAVVTFSALGDNNNGNNDDINSDDDGGSIENV